MSPRKTRSSAKQPSAKNTSKRPPVKSLVKKSPAQNGQKKSAPAKATQTKAMPAKDKTSKKIVTRTRKPQRGSAATKGTAPIEDKVHKPLLGSTTTGGTEPLEDMVGKKEDCNNGLQMSSNGLPNDTVVKAESQESEMPGEVLKVKATSRKQSKSKKKRAVPPVTLKSSSSPTAVDGITGSPSPVSLKSSSSPAAVDGITDSPSRKQSSTKKKATAPTVALKRSSSPTPVDGIVDSPKKKKANGTRSPSKSPQKSSEKNAKYVGAHMSVSGGLELAVSRAVEMGALSFGLFLRSQRQWAAKPLTQEAANLFRDACRKHDFAPHQILPHGSYLLNCGAPDPVILEKSRATLVDELKRCEMLGLVYYNFHPGSTCGLITREECMDRIAESINLAHKETKYVISVIENMCKQGNTIGGDFRELRGIINRVKDKSRIGVCLDTCHAFAAGYDLATEEGFEKMMRDFEAIIGLSYLKALHLNDSKGKVGSHLDRHENIGRGNIGLDGFRRIMNDPRLDHLPMILETPETDYGKEIALLNGLCASS